MDFLSNDLSNKNQIMFFQKSDDILLDMQNIIENAQNSAFQAVNTLLVQRNWLLGQRIAQEELRNAERADYGAGIIKSLSKKLTEKYGKGFDPTNLYTYLRFYKAYPQIVDAVRLQSKIRLSWTHYRILL